MAAPITLFKSFDTVTSRFRNTRMANFELGVPSSLLLCVLSISLALMVHSVFKLYARREAKRDSCTQRLHVPKPDSTPSRLMALPAELRNTIYEHLLPEPARSMPTAVWYTRFATLSQRVLRLAPVTLPFLKPSPQTSNPRSRHLNIMCTISKQFRKEYLDVYTRSRPFTFTLDTTTATKDGDNDINPFAVSLSILSEIRICTLRLYAAPRMCSAFDPRDATLTDDWALRDTLFSHMASMTRLKSMTLVILAVPDQIWNPLWLWHFTSQAFKECPVRAFSRMDFRFSAKVSPAIREPNHLAKNSKGAWQWCCREGHLVQDDCGRQPIRAFCESLYLECRVCDPRGYDIVWPAT